MLRYAKDDKVYIVEHLDMARLVSAKIDRIAAKLTDTKRQVFLRIARALSAAVRWNLLTDHVTSALTGPEPLLLRGNIYDLQGNFNAILRRAERWVRRNSEFGEEKVRDFALDLLKASRSFCRVFDRAATCWKSDSETIVTQNA
ncbi:hypothetical protein [Prosthecomicrobium sp. N25]|uniref:hypothetical protein n=1 Tax=Prosthecomicrobium sp. N25 TaxID=3129254 RepID=UPI003076AC3D